MGQIVPLFGRREPKPQPDVLCAACERVVRRRSWHAWRMRTSRMAQKFYTFCIVASAVICWLTVGAVAYVLLYLEPNKPVGVVVWGLMLILLLAILGVVVARLWPTTLVVEHHHLQEESFEREYRR